MAPLISFSLSLSRALSPPADPLVPPFPLPASHRRIYYVVRRELFQNINQDVQRSALSAFAAVVRMLAGDSLGLSNEAQLVAFLEPVLSAYKLLPCTPRCAWTAVVLAL